MFNLSQKGIAHILVILILLTGIIAGVYLVQHPQIFKPKAFEGEDYAQWVTQMQSLGIYPAQEEGEMVLYNRQQFVEKYCVPDGCYLNPPSFEETWGAIESDAQFIHALGDKLRENDIAPIQALEPFFPDIKEFDEKSLGGALQALEPICRDEPEPICVPELTTYISEEELTQHINQVSTEKALSYRDPIENLIDISSPIFGTRSLINVITLPPNKVSDDDRVNAIFGFTAIWGLAKSGLTLTDDIFVDVSRIIDDVKPLRQSIQNGEAVPLSVVKNQADNWIYQGAGRGLLIKNVAKMTSKERWYYEKIFPLIQSGEAYVLDPRVTRPTLGKLVDNVELAFRNAGLPRLNKKAIMETVDNNWVVVVKDDKYYNLSSRLQGSAAFTEDRLIVVRESSANNISTIAHEFVHVISSNVRRSGAKIKPIGKHFVYDQEQAEVYGATMSQIYELFTDEVVHVFGYDEMYKAYYPQLHASITNFVAALMRESSGRLTRANFSVFALTGNDQQLMKVIIDSGISPQRFMTILNREIDGRKLAEIMRAYRSRNNNWLVPAGVGGGTVFLSAYFTAIANGGELPEDVTIVYEPPDQDIDLTVTQADKTLNCSYSQQDSNCSSGTTVCTGHTPEDICAGKQPEECFNLVGCAYDVNNGSSCSCSR